MARFDETKPDWRRKSLVYNAIERATLLRSGEEQRQADADMLALFDRTLPADRFWRYYFDETDHRLMTEDEEEE